MPPPQSPSTIPHSNSRTMFATKYSSCSSARPSPGQILLPTPNGIILISRLPVRSVPAPSPPSRNLSGRNSSGRLHTFSSCATSATEKFTDLPAGMRCPSSDVSSTAACDSRKCAGGCRRSPSRTSALRYAMDLMSSSSTCSLSLDTTRLISSSSFA
ncbi:Os01g0350100 [Oryza sativa Japonica Group]|uniref:Os01g0350100 protein n=1 Tax=Oryza sativa subsp. japonica TaxID=39947 RepID=A0A0P0V280_ORYSJ|nr:hypothetical protein EE612_002449 [Oryza sativa]BAS72026.1 Os01g0350100 [Oryza sativa Japonica Group]